MPLFGIDPQGSIPFVPKSDLENKVKGYPAEFTYPEPKHSIFANLKPLESFMPLEKIIPPSISSNVRINLHRHSSNREATRFFGIFMQSWSKRRNMQRNNANSKRM